MPHCIFSLLKHSRIYFQLVFLLSDLLRKKTMKFTGSQDIYSVMRISVQTLNHVQLFETPWTAARRASLSITNSWSLHKLMSTESVMPSNHLILCHPFFLLPSIFPSIRSFPMSQFFASGGQSIGVLASTSVLPRNIQD